MDDVTVFGFQAKDFLSVLATGMVGLILFIVRDFLNKAKTKERELKETLDRYQLHFSKIDEALHQLQIQFVEQRHAQADIKEFQNDIKELETRMMRMEVVLTRVADRMGVSRRSTDPDDFTR